jgi:hypothetical protein
MRVQVCIPHYFREHADASENPNGYGSLRRGARLERSIALSRCISNLVNLQRASHLCVLNHHRGRIDHRLGHNVQEDLEIRITICTDGKNQLDDVLDLHKGRIEILKLTPENPRNLPLATRDHLIHASHDADLLCYMEDDIIIHDSEFFDKQKWFLNKTNHSFVLMPHRYERINHPHAESLLVDGCLSPDLDGRFTKPERNAATGHYMSVQPVSFDVADNPHSGTFTISTIQADQLRSTYLPTEGFMGPLETAATLTVLHRFPVMKPSREYWQFLRVEHGNPSFLPYLNTLPHHREDM